MASIDIDKPRYDQGTYMGRAKHFLRLTNPLNCFASDKELDEAQRIVTEFRKTKTLPKGYDEEKLWQTKYLYDSAFHPDTGEKMMAVGRMSAQAPMNTIITGGMITFYKTVPATVFWQWVNQTFNAVVNFTNRSGTAPMPKSQLLASYCCACGGALGTALYLNSKVKMVDKCSGDYNSRDRNGGGYIHLLFQTVAKCKCRCRSHLNMKPVYGRLVPFAAVCGANFINIPMMRSGELLNGTPVFTLDGQMLGDSKVAARTGIGLVCISRVLMALPGMTVTPLITAYATRRGMFNRFPMAAIPFQLSLVALCVTFATPLCCAIFTQRAAIGVGSLETHLQNEAKKKFPKETHFYYNKGL